MNIVDAYKKFNKQLIILVSGMSGSGKTKLAKNISEDFNLEVIKQSDFYKNPYSNDFTLSDGSTTTNWYTYDAYDWDNFNKVINDKKSNGIIVTGLVFPTKFLDFKPDFTLSLSVKKAVLFEKMEKILEQNKDIYPEKYDDFKDGKTKYIFNKLSFPFFLSSVEDSVINKFINVNEMNDDQIYDMAFDYIIPEIEKRVYKLVKTNKTRSYDSASNRLKDLIKSDYRDEYKDYSMKKSASNSLKDLMINKENKSKSSRSASRTLRDLTTNTKESESITSESTDPLEFVLHEDDGQSPYEDTQSVEEINDKKTKTINGYDYGLKGDYLYW